MVNNDGGGRPIGPAVVERGPATANPPFFFDTTSPTSPLLLSAATLLILVHKLHAFSFVGLDSLTLLEYLALAA